MLEGMMASVDSQAGGLALAGIMDVLGSLKNYLLIFIGFSLVIFFHELGHFVAAKLCGVRVHKFAIGFGRELIGFTKGETRYSFNALPLGGYVKMLGQEDFEIDKSSELAVKDDPRAFTNKPVGLRMIIVSAGVFMNVVFAALLFMLVFMIGIKSNPAEVGWIKPGSPAEQIGLRLGDRIVEVNGDRISDQNDLRVAIMLADPDRPVQIAYERKDPTSGEVRREQVSARLERDEDQNVLQLGVAPAVDTTIGLIIPEPTLPPDDQLKVGDEILAVNGQPVQDFLQVNFMVADLQGQFADLRVRRAVTDSADGEAVYEEKDVKWRARLTFQPEGKGQEATAHLLGLMPRVRLAYLLEGERLQQAGLKSGDVVARWGNQVAPRLEEINKSVEENPETNIPVTVLRYENGNTTTVKVDVRPKVPGLLFKRRPTVGIGVPGQEDDRIVVADIVTKSLAGVATPAAPLKGIVPRGAEITRVNGEPVASWSDLVRKFVALAGTEVKLSWTYEGQPESVATIRVPKALGTTFEFPAARLITSIDGKSRVEIENNGRRTSVPVNHWQGAAAVLKESVGRTVEVCYFDLATRESFKNEFAVTEDVLDPWPMRIEFGMGGDVLPNYKLVMVRETNPVKAMMIGVNKTYYFIVQVYVMMKRMIVTRSMGLEQVSGPVGIIKMGSDVAGMGIPSLMYFLALISANLAVINFMPLPIFDGGVFVFLLIEKIKGKPVSIKVQVATQIIGLTLIIGVFLFVTFQDIAKMLGWV